MDNFERARLRYERRYKKPAVPVLPAFAPKQTSKKRNVIEINVYVNEQEFNMRFKAPINTTLLASQLNTGYLQRLFAEVLSSRFGKVEHDAA